MKETTPPFVIESEEVRRLHKASGLSLEDFLATLVEPTRSLARPPISNFHVGAVGLGSSGRVYRGVNIEFPGLPLNFSIHAEQFFGGQRSSKWGDSSSILSGFRSTVWPLSAISSGIEGAGDIRVLIADGKSETQPLSRILPHRFGPLDLLEDGFPLLLETQSNDLHFLSHQSVAHSNVHTVHSASSNTWPSPSDDELNRILQLTVIDPPRHSFNGLSTADVSNDDQGLKSADRILATVPNFMANHLTNSPTVFSEKFPPDVPSPIKSLAPQQLDALQQTALEAQQVIQLRNASLEAANASYAPYTNCPSGLAFSTTRGGMYRGPYFESAAYNPSLPPLQTAIVAFIAEGGGSLEEINNVVLVEKEGAVVRQAAIVRLALEHISPKASFHVFEARRRAQVGLPA